MKIVAEVDGVPADKFFQDLEERLQDAQKAHRVFHQTYQMTHIDAFRNSAEVQAKKIRRIKAVIAQNANLYYIVTKGFSLN